MKVVILCGGMGTRLAEETALKPKPMVEIGGKPILWHIMKTYAAQGFQEFVLALGYKGDLIKSWFHHYRLTASDFTLTLDAHSARDEQGVVHRGARLGRQASAGLPANDVVPLESRRRILADGRHQLRTLRHFAKCRMLARNRHGEASRLQRAKVQYAAAANRSAVGVPLSGAQRGIGDPWNRREARLDVRETVAIDASNE